MFQADAWVLVTTGWIAFNGIWVTFLLLNHLYLIAAGLTTNEMQTGFLRVARRNRKGHGDGRSHGHSHGHAHGKRGGVFLRAAGRLRTLIIGLGGSASDDEPSAATPPLAEASGDVQAQPVSRSSSDTSDEVLPQNRRGGQAIFALRNLGYSQLRSDIDSEKLKKAPYSFGLASNFLDFWTQSAKGRLAGTDWREVMDIAELPPYQSPSAPQLENDTTSPAHMSLDVAI
ncbi:hypothetical protein IWQ57_004603 [Coemansia nantahalensis]|uniref:Uncharacterized protein n=1 Tax=Coemansia nantahalensis TaxID=2789366 RepID=A0ACC1JR94_9FUNG|nr:hypothetical protein IWQ57_004603 [Coemansia nantahalensis]